jgi:hypothetical protein
MALAKKNFMSVGSVERLMIFGIRPAGSFYTKIGCATKREQEPVEVLE